MPTGSDSTVAGLAVADLREQLSMQTSPDAGRTASTITDDELQPYLDAATDIAVDYCGPIVPTQITEVYDGGTPRISLRQWPIVSVDAITESLSGTSTALAVSTNASDGYLTDLGGAMLTRVGYGGYLGRWSYGLSNISVTYTVGRSPVPSAVALGLLILAQHLYGSKIGTTGQRPSGTTAGPMTAYAVPNRVLELWRPFMRGPNIA